MVESVDVELMTKGLVHPLILVSSGDPATNPLCILRGDCIFNLLLKQSMYSMHTFCTHRNQKKTNHQTLEMRAEMFLFEERTR